MPQTEPGKNGDAIILREISQSESRQALHEDQGATLMRLAANPVLLNSYLLRSRSSDPPEALSLLRRISPFSDSGSLVSTYAARSRTDYVPHQPAWDVQSSPEAFYPSDSDKAQALDAGRSGQASPKPEFNLHRWGYWPFLGWAFFFLCLMCIR